jgi:hypothetical protein
MTPPAAAAAPAVRPRRAPAPRGPRRISGPARPATAPRRPATGRPATTADQAGLVVGLLSALESLAQHRLLDRLIRGRVWIGLVAFALIGIVTLQLGLLKLNGGIGRALEHEALLQRENAALSIENSELAAGTRVEKGAARLGMAFVPTGALRFLSATGHGDAGKAAAVLAGAAHVAAQAREARAAEASASSAEAGEGEASSEAAASSEAGGEESSAASASSASSEEAGSSGESSASSESASSEPSTGESAPESASAAASETEPSGGSAAGSAGG